MNLQLIKKQVDEKKYKGGVKGLAEKVGMTEQNIHRCVRENKIQAQDLERIAKELNVPVSYFFDEVTDVKEQYTQVGSNNLQAHKIDKVEVSAHHDPSAVAVGVTDAVLMERLKAMEALLAEKDERIAELKDRISDLKSPSTPK